MAAGATVGAGIIAALLTAAASPTMADTIRIEAKGLTFLPAIPLMSVIPSNGRTAILSPIPRQRGITIGTLCCRRTVRSKWASRNLVTLSIIAASILL
jgi:hypothetical protein